MTQKKTRRLSVGSEYLAQQQDQGTGPVIIAVLRLAGVPNFDSLINQFGKLLEVCPRFRYILVKKGCNGSYFAWQDGPSNSEILKRCIKYKNLEGKNPDDEFEKFLSDRISDSNFEDDLPLWELTAVTYGQDRKNSDVVLRVSHAVADGISLLSLLQYIAEPKKQGTKDSLLDVKDESGIIKSNSQVDLEFQPNNKALNPINTPQKTTTNEKPHKKINIFLLPFIWFFHFLFVIWMYIASTLKVLSIPILPADKKTSLKTSKINELKQSPKISGRVYFSLSEMKFISKKLGVTINDVIISIISGGIRRYLNLNGEKIPNQIRGTAIVNLRLLKDVNDGKEALERLGNHLAYLYVPFLLQDLGAKKRLMKTHKNLMWLKQSPESTLLLGLLETLRRLFPISWANSIATMSVMKTTIAISNLKGPMQMLSLGGVDIVDMFPTINPSVMSTLISAFSYVDKMVIAAAVDKHFVPNPYTLLDQVVAEFEQLKNEVQNLN